MGKPGARKNDPIVSATPGDVHIIMIPSPGGPVPTPIPHPCASLIKDKLATKVKVMGQPGAVKGSKSKHSPPHIPMGPGPFQKPPKNEGEIVTGSSSVFYEGKEAAMLGDTGKMCSDPSDTPVGKVIGTAAMVLIGGGSSGGDAERAAASAAAMKAAGAACHRWINANMPPGADRERAHRDVCTATGHPIDVATGKLFTKNIDLRLPGRIPFEFTRNYSSARSDIGAFGRSWRHCYEAQLVVHGDFVAHRDHNGRFLEFEPIAVGGSSFNNLGRLTLRRSPEGYSVEDPEGLRQLFSWSGSAAEVAVVLPLHQIRDQFNNQITLKYGETRLNQIIDSAGRIVLLDYNERGFVSALRLIADPVVQVSQTIRTYTYSNDDDLIEVRDVEGHALRFAYANHLLVQERDRTGFSFYFTYDQQGWCQETWGDGGILYRHLDYDRQNRRTRVTDSLGCVMTYEWTELGVVAKRTDHWGAVWSTEYNDSLQITRVNDPVGNSWAYEYDEHGGLTTATNPEGAAVAYERDKQGRSVAYEDGEGARWVRTYDETGLVTRITDPMGGVTVESRDERGNLRRIDLPDGRHASAKYDASGNATLTTTPSGLRISRTFSDLGLLLTEADQFGPRERREYDQPGRVASIWRRGRGEMRLTLDAEGRIISIKDAKGRTTSYTYAQFGRIVRIERGERARKGQRASSEVKEFTYDTENRLIAFVTAAGTTRFQYFGRQRPLKVDYPDGRLRVYERDGRDFITKLFENEQLVFEQKADYQGRVTSRRTGDGEEFTYAYDTYGRMTSAAGPETGEVSIQRDALGRLTEERGDLGAEALDYAGDVVRHTWEEDLTLSFARQNVPEGAAWSVGVADRPDIRLEYDAEGRLTRTRFRSGEVHEQDYQREALPKVRRTATPAGEILEEELDYDPTGLLIRQQAGAKTLRYDRDELDRLTLVERLGDGQDCRLEYDFDGAGDRILATDPEGRKYQNKYLRGHRIAQAGDESLRYDARGRVTQITAGEGQTTHFRWDAVNRLRRVELPDGDSIEMRYDALGRRVEKRGPDGTTRFGWVGNQMVHELRPDGGERRYIYDGGSFRPIGCFVNKGDGQWRLHAFTTNVVGTPTRMTDDAGQVVWNADVAPWGESTSDASEQPLSLPGQYHDAETGLHYNLHRYYYPRGAAYLCPDPLGLAGGDDQYAYVADPVCWTDPLGLSANDYDPGNRTVYVIGARDDTLAAQGWPGHEVLNDPNWTPARNDEWVQGIVDRGDPVYLASPQNHDTLWDDANNRERIFARELRQLQAAGYTQRGSYMVPPGTP